MVRHKMIENWKKNKNQWTHVVSALVKTMINPTWKLALNTQTVEVDNILWLYRSNIGNNHKVPLMKP